jgi:hypothetical protein
MICYCCGFVTPSTLRQPSKFAILQNVYSIHVSFVCSFLIFLQVRERMMKSESRLNLVRQAGFARFSFDFEWNVIN